MAANLTSKTSLVPDSQVQGWIAKTEARGRGIPILGISFSCVEHIERFSVDRVTGHTVIYYTSDLKVGASSMVPGIIITCYNSKK